VLEVWETVVVWTERGKRCPARVDAQGKLIETEVICTGCSSVYTEVEARYDILALQVDSFIVDLGLPLTTLEVSSCW